MCTISSLAAPHPPHAVHCLYSATHCHICFPFSLSLHPNVCPLFLTSPQAPAEMDSALSAVLSQGGSRNSYPSTPPSTHPSVPAAPELTLGGREQESVVFWLRLCNGYQTALFLSQEKPRRCFSPRLKSKKHSAEQLSSTGSRLQPRVILGFMKSL